MVLFDGVVLVVDLQEHRAVFKVDNLANAEEVYLERGFQGKGRVVDLDVLVAVGVREDQTVVAEERNAVHEVINGDGGERCK